MRCAHPLYRLPVTAGTLCRQDQLAGLKPHNGAYFLAFEQVLYRFDKTQRDLWTEIGCGQCLACRLNHAKQWTVRIQKDIESCGSDRRSIFLTLTYDDAHLPTRVITDPRSGEVVATSELCKRDLQLFFKRLRNHLGAGIRFFACGEYGGLTSRPHYHAIIWNLPPDFALDREDGYFHSSVISNCWKLGLHDVRDVEYGSIAYVARYCLKKFNDKFTKREREQLMNDFPGWLPRQSEFVVMSRRPGIARTWYLAHPDSVDGLSFRSNKRVERLCSVAYFDRLYDISTKGELSDPNRYGIFLRRKKACRTVHSAAIAAEARKLTDAQEPVQASAEAYRLSQKHSRARDLH